MADTMPQPSSDLFNDKNQVRAAFVKFTQVGDWFEGTLHEVREIDSSLPGKEGEKQKVYDFIVRSGTFHVADPITKRAYADGTGVITLQKGELWSMGGKQSIDNSMRNIKIGQIFGAKFTEEKPSKTKGFAAQKVISIFAGKMDEEYLNGGKLDVAQAFTPPAA